MRVVLLVLVALVLLLSVALGQAEARLMGPFHRIIGLPPPALAAETIKLDSPAGRTVSAWFAPGQRGKGVVVLVHGIEGDRTQMLGRALFLHAAGFTVLLPDLGGHGESGGEHVTFGLDESRDLQAVVRFARAHAPGEKVGLVGVSLGGAAALLGQEALELDALVLESVFPTIQAAMENRLTAWFGKAGHAFALPLLEYARTYLGVDPTRLRPVDAIARVRAPVLVLSGGEDPYTPLREAEELFAHAPEPKDFWAVPGAAHEDLHAFDPAAYEARVGGFLSSLLRG